MTKQDIKQVHKGLSERLPWAKDYGTKALGRVGKGQKGKVEMKILVACEESQAVTIELRKLGHEAYSCDIQECSGGHPEWHIQGDVLKILDSSKNDYDPCGVIEFYKENGEYDYIINKWDMIIAFPPCTYLTNTGNSWFNIEKYGDKARQRYKDRDKAVEFFMAIANADCKKIAIENPIGHMSTRWRKPDQIIHPWHFGDPERKATCLWLKDLELLHHDKNTHVDPSKNIIKYKNGKGTDSRWHVETMKLPPKERAKARSKTFPGIAKAMAEQWAGTVDASDLDIDI